MPRTSFFSLCNNVLRPRLLPILSALITVVGLYYYVISTFIALPKYMFTKDDYGNVQHTIHHMINKHDFSVVSLGGSTMREAFLPKKIMEKKLREIFGTPVQFWNLSSSSQTLTESLAILNTLKIAPGSKIILNLSLVRLRTGQEDTLANYKSRLMPFLDYSEVKKFMLETGIKAPKMRFWNQYGLWLHRVLNALKEQHRIKYKATAPPKSRIVFYKSFLKELLIVGLEGRYYQYYYRYKDYHTRKIKQRPLPTDKKKQLLEKLSADIIPKYIDNRAYNMRLIRYFCQLAKAKGYKVVILILPHDPLATAMDEKAGSDFINDLYSLNSDNLRIVNLSNQSEYSSDDFYDLYHFMDSARAKLVPYFPQIFNNAGVV